MADGVLTIGPYSKAARGNLEVKLRANGKPVECNSKLRREIRAFSLRWLRRFVRGFIAVAVDARRGFVFGVCVVRFESGK